MRERGRRAGRAISAASLAAAVTLALAAPAAAQYGGTPDIGIGTNQPVEPGQTVDVTVTGCDAIGQLVDVWIDAIAVGSAVVGEAGQFVITVTLPGDVEDGAALLWVDCEGQVISTRLPFATDGGPSAPSLDSSAGAPYRFDDEGGGSSRWLLQLSVGALGVGFLLLVMLGRDDREDDYRPPRRWRVARGGFHG